MGTHVLCGPLCFTHSDPMEMMAETQRHAALGALTLRLLPGGSREPSKLSVFLSFFLSFKSSANVQREAMRLKH